MSDLSLALAHAVNAPRLHQTLDELAQFGARDDGGVNRPALSAEDLAARAWLLEHATALGCTVFTDACANLFIRREGQQDLPPVLTGSHIDTQPTGGRYDGCFGVMAGLECLAALHDLQAETLRPIELAVWMNEEGTRYSPGAMGSSAFVAPERLPAYLQSVDSDGISLAAAIAEHSRAFAQLPVRERIAVHAFVELHIEQGPVLEQAGLAVGVVSGIQGVRWKQLRCLGSPAHAGTTPMAVRRDAMKLAIDCVAAIEALAAQLSTPEDLRLTFGRWQVLPNAINTIAGEVIFSVDFRHWDDAVLAAFDARLAAALPAHCSAEALFTHAAVAFDAPVVEAIASACAALQQPSMPLRSGAFHDAMYLAEHCPTGMIFVPSRDGISHNPNEFTEPRDLEAGTRVLAHTLLALANQP
jgi:N-carbamoyl-L-amino-acid hydrolase